jgi:hypothetical protein
MGMYVNACCNEPSNLRVVEDRPVEGGVSDGRVAKGHLVARRCAVCGATHREILADPIPIGIEPGGAR